MGAVRQSMRPQVIFIGTYKSDNMKTIDFMVGDWLRTSRGIAKVIAVDKIGLTFKIDGGDFDIDRDDEEEWFNPIPLTEEILQKNFPTPEEIVWWPLNDGSFRVEMQDDTHLIIGKYNYVHELQHALRLFGKEGEIEL